MGLRSFFSYVSGYIELVLNNNRINEEEELTVDNSIKKLSGNLIVAGFSIDEKSLKIINERTINYEKVKKIILLINRSNITPNFIGSLNALAQDLSDFDMKLEIKISTTGIPNDLYLFDSNSPIYFILRISIDDTPLLVRKSNNRKIKNEILDSLKKAEDITSIRGEQIYYSKYDKLFQIKERGFPPILEEKICAALFQWEKSDYADIKALIDIFEYIIRHFIVIRLKPASRNNWFTNNVMILFDNNIQNKIISRFKKNVYGYTSIDQHPFPVEYLVCENYTSILNSANNSIQFSDYQMGTPDCITYKKYIVDIISARNPPFHSRYRSTQTDFHAETIIKILIVLKWLISLDSHLSKLNFKIGDFDPVISQL